MEYDIMANLRLTIITFALLLSGVAFGGLHEVEKVMELGLSDIQLPAHEADIVRVKQCDKCNALEFAVNRATVYRIGSLRAPSVTLQEFSVAARKALQDDEAALLVGYRPDSNTVTRIVLISGAK
jgi:hypothetical protein